MEGHFNGLLSLMKKRQGRVVPVSTELDDAMFASKMFYQGCCYYLKDSVGISKLNNELAKTEFPIYLSTDFCLKNKNIIKFPSEIWLKIQEAAKNPNSCVILNMQNDNSKMTLCINDLTTERNNALVIARSKLSQADSNLVKEGLEDLIQMDSVADIKAFISKLVGKTEKLEAKASCLIYDIGSMCLSHDKRGLFEELIKSGFSEKVQVFLKGALIKL